MAHILLIEDDEAFRALIAESLRGAGYRVTEARDGREGVRSFHARPVDLVVTDIIMPEQEGLETIRQLRAARANLKIIAITGTGPDGALYLKMAEKLGACRILAKPFRVSEFLTLVEQVLPGGREHCIPAVK